MGSRHYSSSKPVEWLRKKVFKIKKPIALGWGEWGKWDDELKATHPVAFFFTETLPDWLEWLPEHSIDYVDSVRYWIHNYVSGTHRMNSNLKVGQWHEFEERLLHASFDTFVEFIEVETAHSHICWSDKEERSKYDIPWYDRTRWFRWFHVWRSPQAGIDHLKWEMTLDTPDPTDPHWHANTRQANAAREKMALYTWWKHIRPNRGDDWDVSGLREFWNKMDAKYGDDMGGKKCWLGLNGKSCMSPAESRQYKKLSEAKDALEGQWEEEDQQMLIRLVKLRRALWT